MYGIHVPAYRHEDDEGIDGSNRNRREDDSENNQIYNNDEHLSTFTQNINIIHEIWDKYKFGIENRKAANEFLSKERKNCKYTYHQRKAVWDEVSEMARSGLNVTAAYNIISIILRTYLSRLKHCY